MLKLTYTESMFYMERLAQAPERLVASRVKLAMRSGQAIHVQPDSAAFLLPNDLPTVNLLKEAIAQGYSDMVALCVADATTLEVSLSGTWIASDIEAEAGIFVTLLPERTEHLLFNLWHAAYAGASTR
ncbi:MAG: alr0857 family protein [Microcoleaceae cyanobacterium]